jgi:hypothetical protein
MNEIYKTDAFLNEICRIIVTHPRAFLPAVNPVTDGMTELTEHWEDFKIDAIIMDQKVLAVSLFQPKNKYQWLWYNALGRFGLVWSKGVMADEFFFASRRKPRAIIAYEDVMGLKIKQLRELGYGRYEYHAIRVDRDSNAAGKN